MTFLPAAWVELAEAAYKRLLDFELKSPAMRLLREEVREQRFREYARRSGEVICSDLGYHDLPSVARGLRCWSCGAQV